MTDAVGKTTDVLARLRGRRPLGAPPLDLLHDEAADEIERLRAVVLRMVRDSNDCAEPCRSARERGVCGCTAEAAEEMAHGR